MPIVEGLKLNVSEETREFLRRRVESGAYAPQEDVLVVGLEMLREDAEERGRWEREEVLPAYNRAKAHPEELLTVEQLRLSLEQARFLRHPS